MQPHLADIGQGKRKGWLAIDVEHQRRAIYDSISPVAAHSGHLLDLQAAALYLQHLLGQVMLTGHSCLPYAVHCEQAL